VFVVPTRANASAKKKIPNSHRGLLAGHVHEPDFVIAKLTIRTILEFCQPHFRWYSSPLGLADGSRKKDEGQEGQAPDRLYPPQHSSTAAEERGTSQGSAVSTPAKHTGHLDPREACPWAPLYAIFRGEGKGRKKKNRAREEEGKKKNRGSQRGPSGRPGRPEVLASWKDVARGRDGRRRRRRRLDPPDRDLQSDNFVEAPGPLFCGWHLRSGGRSWELGLGRRSRTKGRYQVMEGDIHELHAEISYSVVVRRPAGDSFRTKEPGLPGRSSSR